MVAVTPTGAVPETVTTTGKVWLAAGFTLKTQAPGDGGVTPPSPGIASTAAADDASASTATRPAAAAPKTFFMLPTTPPGESGSALCSRPNAGGTLAHFHHRVRDLCGRVRIRAP